MSQNRVFSALVMAALLSALSVPAASASTPDSPSGRREAALSRLARIRSGVSAESIGGTIRTAAAELGVDLGTPAPQAPTSLLQIADFLSAEVAIAEGAATQSISDPAKLAALHPEVQRTAMTPEPDPSPRELRRLRELSAEIHSLVDEHLIYGAAARLGAAIDSAIPALKAIAANSEVGSGTAPACDLVNTPAVCVGGLEANTYTDDRALLIDLGGDDTYENSAGGADPAHGSAAGLGEGNGLPVSVNIDIAGNDTYSTTLPTVSGSHLAQGAALFGAIGILLDAGGNDVYEASSFKEAPESYGAYAQGFAETGAVAVLADATGNDSYHVESHSWDPDGTLGGALGHGLGGTGAIGALLDGSGNDSYLVEHEPTPKLLPTGELDLGSPVVNSGGSAAYGAGLFADGGGTDQIVAHARTVSIAPDDEPKIVPPGAIFAEAFGFSGFGGVGVALSGDGPTSWKVEGETAAPLATSLYTYAFATSIAGAFSALDDLGGDDTYTARSVGIAESIHTVTDGCDCDGAIAEASADWAVIVGGGWGNTGGVAVISDVAGNDSYSFLSSISARATARDDRTSSGRASAHASLDKSTSALIQGLGFALNGAYGLALDGGGDDRYATSATATAEATATSADPQAVLEATARSQLGEIAGLGASNLGGFGELMDLGGRDVYVSDAQSNATASPATLVESEAPESHVLGSADFSAARFSDIDGGAADVFSAAPSDPACLGVRGTDFWRDCGTGLGIGINR